MRCPSAVSAAVCSSLHYVIQAFSTNGTYQAFDVGRLPGRLRGRKNFGDLHAVCLNAEGVAIDPVTVA
jgi:hypothetical protein